MNRDTEDRGQVLTDQPKRAGMLGRARAQGQLDLANLLEAHHELLDQLVGLHRLTHALEQLVKVPRQRILWSGTVVLDANGTWTHNFHGGTRAIFVVNAAGNGQVTVHANTPGGSPPGAGPGVHIVPPGVARGANNDTTDWTLYGTAGNTVDVEIFGVPIQPSATGNI